MLTHTCTHMHTQTQVGFGEDIQLLSSGPSAPLWQSFEALGRHVAWFLGARCLPWID
jgi:hypothetical protein